MQAPKDAIAVYNLIESLSTAGLRPQVHHARYAWVSYPWDPPPPPPHPGGGQPSSLALLGPVLPPY